MGTHVLQFLNSLTAPPRPLSSSPTKITTITTLCCSCRYRGGSQWDSEERFRFNRDNDFLYGLQELLEDEEFGFKSAGKQRIWWSDDTEDDDDDDDDVDEEDGFGVLESSIGIAWFFKVFRAFGWMLPHVIISMLLGTGPNAFFMALALPLAQSALYLVIDILSGRAGGSIKPKPRSKKRPFARSASNNGTNNRKEQSNQTGKGSGDYRSWSAANNSSVKKGNGSNTSFGGWDELDKQWIMEEVCEMALSQKANDTRQHKKGKLSRSIRNKERPLPLRLLIAIFPFLGSWTKLL